MQYVVESENENDVLKPGNVRAFVLMHAGQQSCSFHAQCSAFFSAEKSIAHALSPHEIRHTDMMHKRMAI